jgi:hypothetical protein
LGEYFTRVSLTLQFRAGFVLWVDIAKVSETSYVEEVAFAGIVMKMVFSVTANALQHSVVSKDEPAP